MSQNTTEMYWYVMRRVKLRNVTDYIHFDPMPNLMSYIDIQDRSIVQHTNILYLIYLTC